MRSNGGAPKGSLLGDANGLSFVKTIVVAAGVIVEVTEVVGALETARPHPASQQAASAILAECRIIVSVHRRHRRARTDGSSDPTRATASATTERTARAARWRGPRRQSQCRSRADSATS